MGIIFDLDQTLIDTQIAFHARSRGRWKDEVYPLVPRFVVYEGILELLTEINAHKIPVCIVTSSPSTYCQMVIDTHRIPISQKVCYHDYKPDKKPHPKPILMGAEKLRLPIDKIISIGDHHNDIIATKNAGAISVGVTWGIEDSTELISIKPHHLCATVEELKKIIFMNR
jgi:phosphoglycolate phosphatase-like HAD superfamily hydrolase